MIEKPNTRCPMDETLAAFVEGAIDPQTRAAVLAHIESCGECMAAVLSANAHLEEEGSGERTVASVTRRSRWWLAAAAALVAMTMVPLLLRREEPVERLVALAPRSARLVEPRLSGGFAWAPYRGPVRAGDPEVDAERLKLGGAAANAIEAAKRDPSRDAQHAAAIALVLIDRPAEAIERLRAIAEQSPSDVRVWNDLAAARYAAAARGDVSLLRDALAATDRALRIDRQSPEALFNRALTLDRLGATSDARAGWERYLAVDRSSPWADEARERLSGR